MAYLAIMGTKMGQIISQHSDPEPEVASDPIITRGDLLQSINLLALRTFCVGHQPTDVLEGMTDDKYKKLMWTIENALKRTV